MLELLHTPYSEDLSRHDLTPHPPSAQCRSPAVGSNTPLFAASEKIAKINVADEIKNSFLDYSMSVIISRALPDVRDGLKPSQRRILYAMHELSLLPDRKHIKCAKICGDTIGQLPSARRSGDLSHARPHGPAVGHARTAGRWPGQLRLGRRRSAGGHALHRGAPDPSGRRR